MSSPSLPSREELLRRIKDFGMRLTRPRRGIIDVLLNADRALSAEDVRIAGDFEESDLGTVYRNLETFQRLGLVQRILLESGKQLVEATAPDEHFHHIICRKCHRTERLDSCQGG